MKLEGEPLTSVNSFKYLGSVIDGSGGCGKDVDGRIKVAWSRWRDLSGVIFDKKVPMKLKSKLYKTVVRPAMVYGSECWALRKQEEQRLHTTEMKMLRWSQGKTRNSCGSWGLGAMGPAIVWGPLQDCDPMFPTGVAVSPSGVRGRAPGGSILASIY